MGIAYANIILENPRRAELKPVEVAALADTGSPYLCIPETVQMQLQLEATSQKTVTTADGKRTICPYVGAIVLGDEVLLGAVPMEDMDLVVSPPSRRVIVNPLHPNFAEGPAK
ncbi:MAG: aspartyl protease family protein [Verrucomicrobiales bacterium]|jgi:hypothetical protein|nr:aspartyl protease family protein [Verrucomicrobiales bacterium]